VPPPSPAPRSKPSSSSHPNPGDAYASGVELLFKAEPVLKIRIDTAIGREMLKQVSSDAKFMDSAQFKVYRIDGKHWAVSPYPGTPNETLVDGVKLTSAVALRNGMRISVGNSAKGIEKMPLLVRLI
jgi:hypothetical protein